MQNALDEATCFAVVTEESLRSADLSIVSARLRAQPSWSDLPFIVLTQRGGGPEHNPGAARLSEILGNVTFLERPFHPTTFVSIARTALKGRQRQYEARARIEDLHEGEERLRTALLAGRLGSWELDLTTGGLTTSATCKALFGRAADDPFTYQDLIDSVHPDDRQRMRAAVRATVETGIDYAIEYRAVWPDRSVRWAEIRARLVNDVEHGHARLVGVSSDITQRRTAEENLRQLNEQLEDRVAERTAELRRAHEAVLAEIKQRERAEEQLRQVQKLEMIGQLTGGIAHDFNNLLMAILGNLDLLRRRVPEEPKVARLIDGALQGAQRGAALTQRLLAFARRQDLHIEPRNLADLVDGMRDLLERSVGSQIDLVVERPAAPLFALVDANQMELALLNLVVNARDAMPEGGVLTIVVDRADASADGELPGGSYARLTVRDEGHGMDAETLRRATEPFFSTKELGKGTGLGLSMIHGLAVQLNGMLRLGSEVGRGTTAELWLPLTSVATEATASGALTSETRSAAEKMTILVVDDDALIAMSTVDMLEDLGHEVLEANTGHDALEILKRDRHVDLLITDYSMPRMTGTQLAKAAREIMPDLPILLATGYADLPPGADVDLSRIAKPYQQEQLAAEIARMMGPSAA